MKVCIIPARGGSKRIPQKNIKDFLGKAIIEYSVEAAINSSVFDKVIVSTDDALVGEVLAYRNDIEINTKRPVSLSGDYASIRDVIRYEIDRLCLSSSDDVCLVYATAPLLCPQNIMKSYKVLKQSAADFLLSVCEYSPPLERALSVNSKGFIQIKEKNKVNSRTQDLVLNYYDAAQFCWGSVHNFISKVEVLNANTIPYILSKTDVVDIDNFDDWIFAESLYKVKEMYGDDYANR